MPDTDEFEIQLIDGFNDAILGCIYEDDGTPLPCYSSKVVDKEIAHGRSIPRKTGAVC